MSIEVYAPLYANQRTYGSTARLRSVVTLIKHLSVVMDLILQNEFKSVGFNPQTC